MIVDEVREVDEVDRPPACLAYNDAPLLSSGNPRDHNVIRPPTPSYPTVVCIQERLSDGLNRFVRPVAEPVKK